MPLDKLSEFLMWSCIINIGILIFSFVLLSCLKDFVYKIHSKLFPMSEETFNVVIYSFFGVYKIVFIVFNLVPYIALEIMK